MPYKKIFNLFDTLDKNLAIIMKSPQVTSSKNSLFIFKNYEFLFLKVKNILKIGYELASLCL